MDEHLTTGSPPPDGDRSCPWCSTPAGPDATACGSCGASLAQRETVGDLQIPGLTSVDPALQDFDKRPLHLRGPSPAQGLGPAVIIGAVAGGPVGLAAIGGVAAVAAVEYLGAGRGPGGTAMPGVPEDLARQAIEQAERRRAARDGGAPEPGPDAGPADGAAGTTGIAGDDGRSIWADLPPADAGEPRTE